MADRFPPRVAAEIGRDKSFGCRAGSFWFEDIDAMADRAERAETSAIVAQNTALLLDSVCHDAMHIIIGLTKALAIYAPAAGNTLKPDADEIFKRWGNVRTALADPVITGLDLAMKDAASGTAYFMATPEGLKRIDHKDVLKLAEEAKDHG